MVHTSCVHTTTIEVRINNRELCLEVLKFILDGIQYGREIKQATGKWIFWYDDFVFAAEKDTYELSKEAVDALNKIGNDARYYEADKLIIHVPLLENEDHRALFNQYIAVR